LSAPAVGQYLSRRFPGTGSPRNWPSFFTGTPTANPLFLVNTIDYLIGQEQLREIDGHGSSGAGRGHRGAAPDTLWQLSKDRLSV